MLSKRLLKAIAGAAASSGRVNPLVVQLQVHDEPADPILGVSKKVPSELVEWQPLDGDKDVIPRARCCRYGKWA